MKKKILFVIDSLSSGGAEKSLVTLLNLIDKNLYDIDLFLSVEDGLYSELVPRHINTQKIPKKNNTPLFIKLFFSIALRLNKLLGNKIHPAQLHWICYSSQYISPAKNYDVAIAYSQGLPTYYVSKHISAPKKISWVNVNYTFAGYKPELDKNKYKKIQKIITVSEGANEIFLNAHPQLSNKTQVIYDLISESVIWAMADKKNPYKTNNTTILTIGRLVYQKGYEIALSAALELKSSGVDFTWYIIGEGNLESRLKQLVIEYGLERNIVFLGTFPNPYPFIKHCDIYCQTSRFEGYGLAIAEARALHKPVVATNFDVVHNQITHNHNGLVTDMDGKSVAAGILKLIKNPELYLSIEGNLRNEIVDSTHELVKINELIAT